MKILYRIFLILLVIGGLNRGLYARLNLNLVTMVFPDTIKSVAQNGIETSTTTINIFAQIVYSLVALSAIRVFIANICKKKCDNCQPTTNQ